MTDYRVLDLAARRAQEFLAQLPERPVGPPVDPQALAESLGGPLPERGEDPADVVEHLVRGASAGLVASPGPRYFGFVIGGSLPAAVAADWLTAAWDQNAALFLSSPAAAVVEDVAGGWLKELLGLPTDASVGFVTGATMANFTCLAAARHEVLRRAGWDVEAKGLQGAPRVNVIAGEEAHSTLFASLRLLGLGDKTSTRVPADEQGRMRAPELADVLRNVSGPTIVCAQAGNVNTGASDPFEAIAPLVRAKDAWLHVDGAFALWAAAVPALRGQVAGVERADSWALDAHKWLNVPYDCGLAFTAHAPAHRAALTTGAAYLIASAARDPLDWTPEASRRARGFTVYAALRSLGRDGVGDLVARCCALARRMAARLQAEPGVTILNEIALNQVLVRFTPRGAGDADGLTRSVIARVQRDGVCWAGGTTWQGKGAMRISVSGWQTTETDIDRSADAIIGAFRAEASSA